MKIQHAKLAMAAASLMAAGTLTVTAQQQAPAGLTARAGARTPVNRALVARTKADTLTTIQGNALNSTNGSLTDTLVRLRDARFGRIVDSQITDKSGLFAFKSIDPGSYIVEVMANDDQTVMAASQLISVNAGEALSAVVKLPFRIPPFAGILGQTSTTASATAVATEAAANSILAVMPTSPISPDE